MDKEKLKAALKARLKWSETSGGDYGIINDTAVKGTKPTYALGYYQFVPKWHWKSIEKLAKEKGYNEGKEIDYDYFLETPALQDEYFDSYFEKDILPVVESAMKNNARNLAPDEIAQLAHMHPTAAKAYTKGDPWKIPNQENNSSIDRYLSDGVRGLKEMGMNVMNPVDVYTPEQIDSKVTDYFTKKEELVKKLDSGELSKGSMSEQLKKLDQDIKNQGLIGQVNTEANRRFQEQEKAFNTDRSVVKKVYDMLSSPEKMDGFRRELDGTKMTIKAFTPEGIRKMRDLIESSGGKLRADSNDDGALTFDMTGRLGNGKYLKEGVKKYGDMELPGMTYGEGAWSNQKKLDGVGKLQRYDLWRGKKDDFYLKQQGSFEKTLDRDLDIVNTKIEADSLAPVPQANTSNGTIKRTSESAANVAKKEAEEKAAAEAKAEAEKEPETKKSNEFYGLSEMEQPDFVEYDKDAYKKEIPFEAAAQGLLGAMGMAAADNKIPERDEKIAAGMQDYIDKIAELTRIGLPPELEAQAKNDLATAYQLGLSNIVRASGGNRNAVLGNQGQLDASKMMGETQVAIADFQAKVDAGNKYGEAMKYVNEFKARKDIANKEMEQTLAMQEREAGGMLAASGFTNMIKSIQDAKERAPGSAYHMMKTKYAMDTFGYDPEMKDDGTGKAGTKSAFLKMRDNINNTNSMKQNILGKYEAMDNQGKLSFEKEYNQNLGKWDYLSQKANELSGMGNNSLNLNSTDPQTKPLQNDTTMTENDFKAVDTTSDLSTMMAFQSNRYSV